MRGENMRGGILKSGSAKSRNVKSGKLEFERIGDDMKNGKRFC